MQRNQSLDRFLSGEEDRDSRKGDDISDELRDAIDQTRQKIREAFGDGKRAKAKLKNREKISYSAALDR